MIQVKNKKIYNGDGFYIGRPTMFGNPFSHKNDTLATYKTNSPEESVSQYKIWFYEQIKTNDKFKKELQTLIDYYRNNNELTMICWCNPRICHGDVIKEYIEGLK
jgi:hypothetical protein